MAEADQSDDKTEEPSQRKLDDARAKGQVALSRDVTHAAILAMAAGLLAFAVPHLGAQTVMTLRWYLEHAGAPAGQIEALRRHWSGTALALAGVVAIPAGGFILAAIAAIVGQQGFLWSSENLKPKFERLSPLSGFTRMFGGAAFVEFAKNSLKVVVIGWMCWAQLQSELPTLLAAVGREPIVIGAEIGHLMGRVALICAITAGAFAILDVVWQRFRFKQKMRMSRQDLKDEAKQSEGDPAIKQRLRAIRMARSRQRMLADVPKATVVITNPTHFAVALRYENGQDAAPLVVAKGVDHLAAVIRKTAAEHGVPLIENPPLARALHAMVEVGRPIPVEHYRAVADVIAMVMRLRRDGRLR